MPVIEVFTAGVDQVGAGVSDAIDYLELVSGLPEVEGYKRESLEFLRTAGRRFVELGCGLGEDARRLAQITAGQVWAMDVSAGMVAAAARRGTSHDAVRFLQAAGEKLPLANGRMDGCRIDRTLQHVQEGRWMVEEAFRVLRGGGRLVICEPDWETLVVHGGERSVTRRILNAWCDRRKHGWVGRDLDGLLRAAGFEVEGIRGHAVVMQDALQADRVLQLSAAADYATGLGLVDEQEALQWKAAVLGAGCWSAFVVFVACSTRPSGSKSR